MNTTLIRMAIVIASLMPNAAFGQTLTIAKPMGGNGNSWDCNECSGTATGCGMHGATVNGSIDKKVSGVWKKQAPWYATAINTVDGNYEWETEPAVIVGFPDPPGGSRADPEWTCKQKGQYKAEASAMSIVIFTVVNANPVLFTIQ